MPNVRQAYPRLTPLHSKCLSVDSSKSVLAKQKGRKEGISEQKVWPSFSVIHMLKWNGSVADQES